MKVVYGHTDSIYVTIPTIDRAKDICSELNSHVQELFPNVLGLEKHPVQLEFEKYYQALGVGTVKNRNAGLISWEDGVYLSKPKFTMTGFTAKRLAEVPLAKEVQKTVLEMWVKECPQSEITEYCRSMFNSVKLGNIDLKKVVKRQRLKSDRLKVKCPDCKKKYDVVELYNEVNCECGTSKQFFTTFEGKRPTFGSGIAGALWWNNTVEGKAKPITDSFYFVKINQVSTSDFWTHPLTNASKRVEWISAPSLDILNKLLEEVKIDYNHYSETVVSKAKPIYDAMGWPTDVISLDERQTTLDDWF